MKSEDFALNAWKRIVAGIPIWWILGFNFFIFHFLAFIFTIRAFYSKRENHGLYIVPSVIALFLLAIVFLSSIFIHLPENPAIRFAASIYNLSFWFMGIGIILCFSNYFDLNWIPAILNAFQYIAIITGILALALLIPAFSLQEITFQTPLYFLSGLLGNSPLANYTFQTTLLQNELFASTLVSRFNAFSPYPTATGGMMIMTVLMLITKALIEKRIFGIKNLLLLAISFLAIIMSLSRVSLLALMIGLGFMFFMRRKQKILWMMVLIVATILLLPLIDELAVSLLNLREGSTFGRSRIYLQTLEQFQGVDYLIGFGIKPQIHWGEEIFSSPLGSHSTPLALMFKSGLLGLSFFILWQVSLWVRWYRLQEFVRDHHVLFSMWLGFGGIFLSMLLWMLTDDLDAPQVTAFLYFSCVGFFEGFQIVVYRKEHNRNNRSESWAQAC